MGAKYKMQALRQAWWAPLAAVLALSLLGVAAAFIFGRGTSNLLDAESMAAGVSLSLSGVAALATGLWIRPHKPGLGSVLVIVGALLAGIWFWIIFMTPLATAVIVGVVVSHVRSTASSG